MMDRRRHPPLNLPWKNPMGGRGGGTPIKEEGRESGDQWEVEAEGDRGIGALSLTIGIYSSMWPEAERA